MTTPIDELVISSAISASCEKLFREYIGFWCIKLVSEETMLDYLDDYWEMVKKSLIHKEPA
jgi:hypothetical protein